MAIVSLAVGKKPRCWRIGVSTIAGTLLKAAVTVSFVVSAVFSGLANADKPLTTVADLRYGAALYDYYLGDYFQALSELMVAEQRDGIQGHSDNPKLIEGGISLSFGMERKSGEIFNELLSADAEGKFTRPLEVRNAAWFYLGKLRYLRGDWDGTEESFARISGRFDKELLAELEALVINLAIRRGNIDKAIENLDKAKAIDEWLPYLYYNLGNAYARQQNFSEAIDYYRRLADLPFNQDPVLREEQLVLVDRAFTSAGYSYVLQGQQQQAINQFTKVRLTSPFSNRALLGYGWAAAESQQYELALKPWQELASRSLVHASTQEAIIAVPFAYEQMGAKGQALQEYLNAELTFKKEITRLESVQADLDQLDFLAALDIKDTDERNWFKLNDSAVARPSLTYLSELFSLNLFQGSVQELRDLMSMRNQLQAWREKLDAYTYMMDQREVNRAGQMQDIAERNLEQQLVTMQAKRDALDARLNKIVAEQDYFALAEGDQKEFIGIVRNMERTINALRAAGQKVVLYEGQERRAKFYKGLLMWQGMEDFPDQQWQVRRVINELDRALAEGRENLNRLNRAVVEAPDVVPYRQRMAALNERLGQESARVADAVSVAETRLRALVSEELASQRSRLQLYQSQARLSVARLYDSALQIRVAE